MTYICHMEQRLGGTEKFLQYIHIVFPSWSMDGLGPPQTSMQILCCHPSVGRMSPWCWHQMPLSAVTSVHNCTKELFGALFRKQPLYCLTARICQINHPWFKGCYTYCSIPLSARSPGALKEVCYITIAMTLFLLWLWSDESLSVRLWFDSRVLMSKLCTREHICPHPAMTTWALLNLCEWAVASLTKR